MSASTKAERPPNSVFIQIYSHMECMCTRVATLILPISQVSNAF